MHAHHRGTRSRACERARRGAPAGAAQGQGAHAHQAQRLGHVGGLHGGRQAHARERLAQPHQALQLPRRRRHHLARTGTLKTLRARTALELPRRPRHRLQRAALSRAGQDMPAWVRGWAQRKPAHGAPRQASDRKCLVLASPCASLATARALHGRTGSGRPGPRAPASLAAAWRAIACPCAAAAPRRASRQAGGAPCGRCPGGASRSSPG